MSVFSSYKKIFLLGFIIVILITIPLSVFVAQKSQRITSKASRSTTLYFDQASPTVKTGDILTLGVMLNPGTGATANQVSFVKLSISFDPNKFTTVADSLKPNTESSNTLTTILEDPVYESGKATISLSIGADPARVVSATTKIAILKLKSLSATSESNPSSITFDPAPNTQVLSIASGDGTSENVLSTTEPANATITGTAAPSQGITPTATPTPLPPTAPTAGQGVNSSIPNTTTENSNLATGETIIEITPIIPEAPEVQITEILPTVAVLPPTGPGDNILGLGIMGVILTIIGGALFILL
ncbi:MAG: hypothetical protein Q8P26_00235 [Candidatus Levybacteria bacterium]|nr:hypothetical protein [Candidatus Levybacteria bacterium]